MSTFFIDNLKRYLNGEFKILEINSENFTPQSYDENIDQRCHRFINDRLKKEISDDCKFIILPVSVTKNFLEFSGLQLAHHIRLTPDFNNNDTPILVYGYLDIIQLQKLTPLANILLTDNVEYVNLNNYTLEQIAQFISKYQSKSFNLGKFIDTIRIDPPANYDSHHSIDNEYAIVQWSKYIGCYKDLPEDFKKEFDSQLYFKYLNVRHSIEKVLDSKKFLLNINQKTTILLIDDEEAKGWSTFYKSFLSFTPNIIFENSNLDFKSLNNQDVVLAKIVYIIRNINPDIVLLDLRLIDSDFDEETKPEELTGIKVIEKIKEFNNGIQVIVTTASNKAWNFNLAKQKGAYDFIIKDGFDNPKKSIDRLKSTIEICAKKARYLKPISEKIRVAIENWKEYNIHERKNLEDQMHDKFWHIAVKQYVSDFLINAYSTTENETQKERFTISVLLLYRILEIIKEFFVYQRGEYYTKTLKYFFDQDNSELSKISFVKENYIISDSIQGEIMSTLNQIYAIYYKINNNTNRQLFENLYHINNYRNNVAVHPDKRFKEESLEYLYVNDFEKFSRNIIDFFGCVCEFISSFKNADLQHR